MNRIFETTYKNDRRKHKHRCRYCRKIILPSMQVLMYRHNRGTYAVHIECADVEMPIDENRTLTYRQLFHLWEQEKAS